MKVGDVVWVFDENRRVYARESGHSVGGPIWLEHWVEQRVVHENRVAFFVAHKSVTFDPKRASSGRFYRRVPKKGRLPGWLATSREEIERQRWARETRYKLREALERCHDYETLVRVAALLLPEVVRLVDKDLVSG